VGWGIEKLGLLRREIPAREEGGEDALLLSVPSARKKGRKALYNEKRGESKKGSSRFGETKGGCELLRGGGVMFMKKKAGRKKVVKVSLADLTILGGKGVSGERVRSYRKITA